MQAWDLAGLVPAAEGRARYHEFQRSAGLSSGVYVIPRGAPDPQKPHAEDEVYHVIRGRGAFVAAGKRVAVGPGTILFVPAREEHRFVDVEEDLVVLVAFGPAESRP